MRVLRRVVKKPGRMGVALAAALVMPAAAPAAVAEETKNQQPQSVGLYALPVGAKVPSLEQLRSGKARMAQPSEPVGGRLPMETVGPAAAHLPLADTPSAMAPDKRTAVRHGAATYPEPPRSMTKDECKKGLHGGKLFYVKSRFAMCNGTQMIQTWAKNGRVTGQSSFTLWVISTVPDRKDRTVKYQYLFTDFFDEGQTGTRDLKITTDARMKTWPSRARSQQGGLIPPTKTFAALKASPKYEHTVVFDAGQGRGKDDVISMAYEPYLRITIPPRWVVREGDSWVRVGFLAAQWDAASYLYNPGGGGNAKKKGGAAFPIAMYLTFSTKAGAPERAVALHLKKAHEKPADTKPVNSRKKVPGFDTDHKLHRVYHDVDGRDRKEANRRAAKAVCVKYWGSDYSQGERLDCDEYPNAVTYEGSAQHQFEPSTPEDNFSAMPLDKIQNRTAGSILSLFLKRNRIVDGRIGNEEIDGFMMQIK